jgi:hypothetical protein
MAIDLKNLIDQVLGMARESLDLRKRNAEASWYGGNKDEEEYWKEMRRRNTELELRGAEGKNRLAEREMINTGDLEKQRVADAGALARQGLTNEATRYTADQNLQAHQYTADTNYAMKRDELNKGYDPELIKAHAAVIANVNSSPEAVASSQAAIDWYTKEAVRKKQQAREALTETPQAAPALPAPASPKNEPDGIIGEILAPAPNQPAAPNAARQTLGATITQPPKKKRFEDMTPDELRAEDEAWISKNKSAMGNIPFWAGSKPSEAAAWNRKLISEGKKREDLFNRQ